MEVDQDAPIVYRSQKVVRDAKRTIQGREKDPPLEIDDHEGFSVLFELHDALAGTGPGVVRRTDHARGFRKMGHELGLVPNMVSGRNAVHSERKQLLKYFLREAASCSGVLTVCNQEILLAMPLPENREPFGEAFSAGAPHDVADKENPHRIRKRYFAYSVARVSLLTVTLICPGYFISSSIFRAISNASL